MLYLTWLVFPYTNIGVLRLTVEWSGAALKPLSIIPWLTRIILSTQLFPNGNV